MSIRRHSHLTRIRSDLPLFCFVPDRIYEVNNCELCWNKDWGLFECGPGVILHDVFYNKVCIRDMGDTKRPLGSLV